MQDTARIYGLWKVVRALLAGFILVGWMSSCYDNPVLPTYQGGCELVQPVDGEVLTENSPVFIWKPYYNAIYYQLYIYSYPVRSDFDDLVESREAMLIEGDFNIEDSQISYQLKSKLPSTVSPYQWKVKARTPTRFYESELFAFTMIDEVNPTVTITSPEDNARVDGVVTISGIASDNGLIDLVQVRIDGGEWIEATGTDTFSYKWDTRLERLGSHLVEVQSTDSNGLQSDITSVTLNTHYFLDEFAGTELESVWTVNHLDGDGSTSVAGGLLRINSGTGGLTWNTPDQASLVYMELPTEDFTATIFVKGLSAFKSTAILGLWVDASDASSERYLIQSDADNYTNWGISSRLTNGGSVSWDYAPTAANLLVNFYIQISLIDQTYSISYSADGTTYQSFLGSNPITPSQLFQHLALMSGGDVGNISIIFNSIEITL